LGVRKTDGEKILLRSLNRTKLADEKCSDISLYEEEFESFWNITESDDYGNGVIHNRTQMLSSFNEEMTKKIDSFRLKNARKPTDIIVVTDGLCFSACSFFVNNVIEKGSGIVTGIGGYNPGDKLFVASQNPSYVLLSLPAAFSILEIPFLQSGVRVSCTFVETFPVLREEGTPIPRDYTLSYIDKHLGVYPHVTHFTTEYDDDTVDQIIDRSLALRQEFQETCNPKNKRLMFVTEKCKSSDKNAMFSGYQCGDDGKWDKSKCFISTCKPGYHVDFKNNNCVPSPCLERSSSTEMNKAFLIVSLFALAVILL